MRENAEAKGRRYVLEGRLLVVAVDETIVRASCRGSGAVWEIEFDGESWSCSCPATRRCSHLIAAQLVTVRPGWPELVGVVDDPEPVVSRPEPSAGAAFEDEDPEPHVSREHL